MKKSLVLFLVATLLLAGCTELLDSEDGETKKIEINEDIAFEKINDFMTVDEGESFGITMMYEMDSSMLAESGLVDADEDSDAVLTMEMTEAWSPAGYHTSSIMGMSSEGVAYKMVETMTHIGTTMYVTIGYDATGSLPSDATDDEKMQFEMIAQQGLESYSMTTSNSHTEVIASMAEETQDNGDDMDMMEMLEVFKFTECMGEFTPSNETVDGLQIFDVTMVDMEDSMTPDMALCLFDTDDSDSISFEEFTASDDTEEDDVDEMRTVFDNADADADGELNSAELVTFIEAVDSHDDEEDHMHGDEDEHMHDEDESGEMPDMSVAFNDAGEIEYFGMSMDGTDIQMYVLTEDKVSAFFSGAEAGELVALPFSLTDSMDDDEYDMGDGNDHDDDDGTNHDDDDGHDHGDDQYETWTFNREMSECDSDADEMVDFNELDACVSMDLTNDGYDSDSFEGLPQMFDMVDADEDGLLDSDEFKDFEAMTSGDDDHSDDSYIDAMVEEWMASMDSDGDNNISWEEYDAFLSNDEGWESDEDRNDSMMLWADYDLDSNGGLDEYELAELLAMTEDDDGGDDAPSPQDLLDMSDTDSNGAMTIDEFNAFMDQVGEPFPQEMSDDINMIFDDADTDDSGDLDIDELEQFIMDIDEYMMSMEGSEEMFTCDDGEMIPMDYVNDGYEDCAGGEDEDDMGGSDDHDHGDSDDSDEERVWYITNEMDFHFEGDMNDYSIVLETCEEDMDMETGEMTKDCSTYMTVSMNDAMLEGSSVMFHDTDSSGTISDGDMIHVSETDNDWNEVRLYSSSADAYSDENPMHNTPGFTGIVGMLALLGAAFIRRNE